jgi:hypothetical protein
MFDSEQAYGEHYLSLDMSVYHDYPIHLSDEGVSKKKKSSTYVTLVSALTSSDMQDSSSG